MLIDEIRSRVTAAMKARNTIEKEILRVALGEIQTEEARGAKLDDAAVERILRKLVKSNQETAAASSDPETKSTLAEENRVLESLLPQMLGEEEIIAALAEVADAIVAAKADGPATGVAMKLLKSKGLAVDGRTVGAAVAKMRG